MKAAIKHGRGAFDYKIRSFVKLREWPTSSCYHIIAYHSQFAFGYFFIKGKSGMLLYVGI